MDLYNASKIFYIKFEFRFLNINQVFQKFSQICLSYICCTCFNETSAVRCFKIVCRTCFRNICGAICRQCKRNFKVLRVSFLSSKCLFRIFPRSTDFPCLSLLLAGLESNCLRPDPLAGPRSCQRAPRWIQRCARLWRLTCHFGERT